MVGATWQAHVWRCGLHAVNASKDACATTIRASGGSQAWGDDSGCQLLACFYVVYCGLNQTFPCRVNVDLQKNFKVSRESPGTLPSVSPATSISGNAGACIRTGESASLHHCQPGFMLDPISLICSSRWVCLSSSW